MSSIQKWTAGTVAASFTTAFSSEVLGLPNLDSIQSSIVIDNSTIGDQFCIASCQITSSSSTPNTSGLYLSVGLYPLNLDTGTTIYGDNQFASQVAAPIPGPYATNGTIPVIQNSTGVIYGTTQPFQMYPGKQVLVLYNASGVILSTTLSNTVIKYKTVNLGLF